MEHGGYSLRDVHAEVPFRREQPARPGPEDYQRGLPSDLGKFLALSQELGFAVAYKGPFSTPKH